MIKALYISKREQNGCGIRVVIRQKVEQRKAIFDFRIQCHSSLCPSALHIK
ncbi:hypothetical protein EMIT013CA1_10134 [Bacillus sp. IT-13CA1]